MTMKQLTLHVVSTWLFICTVKGYNPIQIVTASGTVRQIKLNIANNRQTPYNVVWVRGAGIPVPPFFTKKWMLIIMEVGMFHEVEKDDERYAA